MDRGGAAMGFVLLVVALGFVTAVVAKSKGRSPIAWGLFGAACFILALPLLLLAQSNLRTCPHCAEHIKPEARVCRFCGREIDAPGTAEAAAPPARGEA